MKVFITAPTKLEWFRKRNAESSEISPGLQGDNYLSEAALVESPDRVVNGFAVDNRYQA